MLEGLTINFVSELQSNISGTMLTDEPLNKWTTIGIGGRCEYFVKPQNERDIIQVMRLARKYNKPLLPLGRGSNVLIADEGIKGIVLCLNSMKKVKFDGGNIEAEAGAPITGIVKEAAKRGLSNLEFAIGIPGTVGGAVIGNAGAYGKDMSNVTDKLHVIDHKAKRIINNENIGFKYRETRYFKNNPNSVISRVYLKLIREKSEIVDEKIQHFMALRKKRQVLGMKTFGSVFKNPSNDYAGRLLEQVGLKNTRIGDAMVSSHHANFIINLRNARAKDVYDLICLMQDKVKNKFGILLDLEVKLVGF